jgi:hypothetical protein
MFSVYGSLRCYPLRHPYSSFAMTILRSRDSGNSLLLKRVSAIVDHKHGNSLLSKRVSANVDSERGNSLLSERVSAISNYLELEAENRCTEQGFFPFVALHTMFLTNIQI